MSAPKKKNMEGKELNSKTIEILEYNKIKERLMEFTLSDEAKIRIENLTPSLSITKIEKDLLETTEARAIADINSSIPLHSLKGMNLIKNKLNTSATLSPEDLETISTLLKVVEKLMIFMEKRKDVAPVISEYARSCYELSDLKEEILKCITSGRVDDKASPKLSKIRKKILILQNRIKNKLDSLITDDKFKGYLQDPIISMRDGRYVVPIKTQHKNNVSGEIHDKSQSGSTVFVEPVEVKKLQDELNSYKFEEEKEVYRILSSLTNLVCEKEREINIDAEVMANYDFIFAKGRYSKLIQGRSVKLNTNNYINIIDGRHPMLGNNAVPLNFEIGRDYKGVVITGPNTGGKTVALKTVGLLTMMAQSGLHVPVGTGSEMCIFGDILADIGDGQSIEQSLSTFSSHIKNIISILNCADKYTLVILDELGAGTDPGEGMGLAAAILSELYKKGATILATTHYSEIKDFAREHEGFINGSMEFDINSLKPLYRLKLGKAGESNAFLIAIRLGMDKNIIEKAHFITYKEEKDYSRYVKQYENYEKKIEDNHREQLHKIEEVKSIEKLSKKQGKKDTFTLGDCVFISFMGRTGVICEGENSKGEYGVMVAKKKIVVNKKRLSIYIENKELYPEDYDYDIVFKSKEDRKKNKLMNKHHMEGMSIEVKK